MNKLLAVLALALVTTAVAAPASQAFSVKGLPQETIDILTEQFYGTGGGGNGGSNVGEPFDPFNQPVDGKVACFEKGGMVFNEITASGGAGFRCYLPK